LVSVISLERKHTKSSQAYLKYREIHAVLSALPHTEFQAFINPTNTFAQILLAHYVALVTLMAPIKSREWEGRNIGTIRRYILFKLDGIWNNVPGDMRGYIYWPMKASGSIPGIPPYLKVLYPPDTETIDGF
jgi:hypothetical protein